MVVDCGSIVKYINKQQNYLYISVSVYKFQPKIEIEHVQEELSPDL